MKTLNLTLLLVFLLMACSKGSSDSKSEDSTAPVTPSPTTTTTLAPVTHKTANGYYHNCVINSSGAALCAGNNYDSSDDVAGLLGAGITAHSNTQQTTFSAVNDSGVSYISIVSGETQSCALTSAQKVKCWGKFGVGDGTSVEKTSPTLITDTSSLFVDIASGSYHSCGVTSTGVLKCWGDGWDAKLGNGDTTGVQQDNPIVADSGTLYRRVATGRNHTCGITLDRALKCWGTNDVGQVGVGHTTTPQASPIVIDSGTSYAVISAGQNNTCGVTVDGALKCWGDNSKGQIGDASATTRPSPTPITPGTSYSTVSVAQSGRHVCAITTLGALYCWGFNSNGQLGNTNTTDQNTPQLINSGTTYQSVSAGRDSTCAVTTGGDLQCWGENAAGKLGRGNTTPSSSPVAIGTGY